jgi:hypothetical protein
MATGKLVGHDEDTVDVNHPPNYIKCAKYTAVGTGNVTEFRIRCSGSGNVKVAIYADSDGEPGARLGVVNTATAVVAGWNTIAFPSTPIVSGTDYWLAFNSSATIVGEAAETRQGRFKAVAFANDLPDPAGTGYTADTTNSMICAGWGILVISPSGLSQPISYGTPKLSLSIKPPGYQQSIAYGTPTVGISGIVISPQGIAVIISYGTPALRYPQTISPPGLAVPIACGTPSIVVAGVGVIYVPGHQQAIAYGTPTILKYVWHVILDGQYNIESPETNRAFVIGRDVYGNPVYGEAQDADESALVGERLDFQPDPAIPTTAQAGDVASAVLSKMRLRGKGGVILIPPNCGQELFDVVQISDAGANQAAVSFRVVGIRFEYSPKQARYQHRLLLGTP